MSKTSYYGSALLKIALLVFLFLITACANEKDSSKKENLNFYGSASVFFEGENPAFESRIIVENSLVNFNNSIIAFFDQGAVGNFAVAELGNNGHQFLNATHLNTNRRFSYVLNYNGILYNFFNNGGSIFLEKSLNGINWQLINNGQPVLTSDYLTPNSIYHYIWNVGVTVDSAGTWHMLVEASDISGNGFAGLGYLTAQMVNDTINFDINKSQNFLITQAGNPYVTYIQGKGLLIIYGRITMPNENFGNEWYITAATFDLSTHTVTEYNNFQIGTRNIHVCDPHMVELPDGRTLLSVSFDQSLTYLAYTNHTLSELFDLVSVEPPN